MQYVAKLLVALCLLDNGRRVLCEVCFKIVGCTVFDRQQTRSVICSVLQNCWLHCV